MLGAFLRVGQELRCVAFVFFRENGRMNTRNWHSLVTGTALLMLVGGVTNSCKDFLDQAPQGAASVRVANWVDEAPEGKPRSQTVTNRADVFASASRSNIRRIRRRVFDSLNEQ